MLQGMHRSGTDWASPLSSMTQWRVKKTSRTNVGRSRPKTAKQEETWKLYRRAQWTGKNCPTGRPQHPTRIQRYVTLSETKSEWRRRAPSTYLSISTLKYPSLSFRQFPSISRICRAQKGHIEWWNHLRSTVSWVPCWTQVAQQNREDKFKSPKETHKNPIYGVSQPKMQPKKWRQNGIYLIFRYIIHRAIQFLRLPEYPWMVSILRFHILGAMNPAMLMYSRVPPDGISSFSYSKIAIVGSPCLRNTPLAES